MKEADNMSKSGAEDLARRIKTYWAGKGVKVSPEVVQQVDATGRREYIYVVRSDIKFLSAR